MLFDDLDVPISKVGFLWSTTAVSMTHVWISAGTDMSKLVTATTE